MLACERLSHNALPRSATADDVWPRREREVERTRAKIVTSGTFLGVLVPLNSETRSFVAKWARYKTCRL
jgi:hypothetical protein